MTEFNEDRYEAIEMLIKSRSGEPSWFDIIFDYISQDCQGSEEEGSCTCGMESMGSTSGTIDQCWKYLGIDDDKVTVMKADLQKVLNFVTLTGRSQPIHVREAAERLSKEITWWDDILDSLPEDEEQPENGKETI